MPKTYKQPNKILGGASMSIKLRFESICRLLGNHMSYSAEGIHLCTLYSLCSEYAKEYIIRRKILTRALGKPKKLDHHSLSGLPALEWSFPDSVVLLNPSGIVDTITQEV